MSKKSTAVAAVSKAKGNKPPKPRPDFPLYAHKSGKWCKVVRGKMHDFGTWADPHGAETAYLKVAEDLHAGRTPRRDGGGVTARELCNSFVKSNRMRMFDIGDVFLFAVLARIKRRLGMKFARDVAANVVGALVGGVLV